MRMETDRPWRRRRLGNVQLLTDDGWCWSRRCRGDPVWYNLCLWYWMMMYCIAWKFNCLDVFCCEVNTVEPQLFNCFIECSGRVLIGRDRSLGGSDGSTSLNVDMFDFIFLRFPYVSISVKLNRVLYLYIYSTLFRDYRTLEGGEICSIWGMIGSKKLQKTYIWNNRCVGERVEWRYIGR